MYIDEDDEPDLDVILAQTTALLYESGDEHAVALLVDVHTMGFLNSERVVSQHDDGWGGTRNVYSLIATFDVEGHLVDRFTDEVSQRILAVLKYVAGRHGFVDIDRVDARPALPEIDGSWRDTYSSKLATDRPTNQARRERGIASYPAEDGMTFGSLQEVQLYRALKHLQSRATEADTFAILPSPGAYLRAGNTWTPDLVVVGRGRAVVIEVDGPHHRAARRVADDRNRDLQWRRCGVEVVRIPVEDLRDETELMERLREELIRTIFSTRRN